MQTTVDNQNQEQPKSKGNIVLKSLSKLQKDKLLTSKLGLAAVGIGLGAFALVSFISKEDGKVVEPENEYIDNPDSEKVVDSENPEINENVVICTEAPFAKTVTDDMDFEKAYETAREEVGPGGFFEFQDNLFNTYTKEEWNNMTEEQQHNYWSSIDNDTTQIETVSPDQRVPMIESSDESAAYAVDVEPIIIPDVDHDFDLKIIKETDLNKDGQSDAFIVDANGNEIPDLILDTDYDGKSDYVMIDVKVEDGTMHFENAYEIHDGVIDYAHPIDTDGEIEVENLESDNLSGIDLNPSDPAVNTDYNHHDDLGYSADDHISNNDDMQDYYA